MTVASDRRATLSGLLAIVLWATVVGLTRLVTESFGATLGNALICTFASVALWATRRPGRLRDLPLRYLVVCGGLFVLYQICMGLSVGFARDAHQAIEVSIVNYLWPTFTVLLAVALPPKTKVGWVFAPGVLLAVAGVVWVIGGDAGLDPGRMATNLAGNPVPYALALAGALSWAFYSTLTPRLARGADGITLFMTASAVAGWALHLVGGGSLARVPTAGGIVALGVASVVIAAGYAFWNTGVLRGNLPLLASASYATPVLSAATASLLLGAALSASFWQGVVLVTVGSLLGWRATAHR
ncbi:MAG: aromatic amino acid DMT transporter YddG [Tessaracoccus sp.]|uniref:aromatic amino acid DMT transporter YddG n=1 Tax=Tessaracoccus sp. TaxID=1971211 RepID=UPI001EB720A8|nr:aromatic amino acid DMT transporter YddG [Tessaracoccus sp.]MBK7822240.1 aromatic amino acid DMT transporter YddG [Tessaracoccus sp.]